ncbi:ABC transporter substrate-binding protein [Marinimicrococcus flavescens]|uniref:Extracellular solute-binding protein n=1 Tax=Marinimicrococcus flavescens TaxID=3031815 RepID=A0AAP3V084_9PROT|nr:extracellular solute-binding protein [Marinimicrococcus flavescens]
MKETRRIFLGATFAAVTALAAFAGPAAAAERPDYYPADYDKLVEASKSEQGLLVYSNMAEYNWAPVIKGFNELYPWIKVETLDLGGEIFERYYAENSSGTRTADMVATGSIDNWLEFTDKGEAVDYKSPEADKVPDWAKPRPGLYTVSTDPMIIVYNKQLLPEAKAPKSIHEIAELVKSGDTKLDNKLTTYNAAASSFGLSLYWAWVHKHDDAWDVFDTLGPLTRPERSAGPQLEKITSGEYTLGWFLSGIVVFPKMSDPARKALIGWHFPQDGTPIFMRGMAVAKGAKSPNSAKLMLDFILSHAGQVAFGKGGLTPYRPDVKADEVPFFTYSSITEAVGGESNVVLVEYDREMLEKRDEFLARWKKAFSQAQ